MDVAPRIDSYEWAGGREAMLRFGPDDGPVVVLALPLFEEANRTRAFGVSILRALAARGVGGVLPDLPGQGESEEATVDARLVDWRAAFAAVPGTHALAIRSGALVIDNRPCWLLAPQDGPTLLRELARMKGGRLEGEQVEVTGNLLCRSLIDDLGTAFHPGAGRGPVSINDEAPSALPIAYRPDPGLRRGGTVTRVVRLSSDAGAADLHVEGSPLWRRAEPDNDPALVQRLVDDIADGIAACDG